MNTQLILIIVMISSILIMALYFIITPQKEDFNHNKEFQKSKSSLVTSVDKETNVIKQKDSSYVRKLNQRQKRRDARRASMLKK